MFLLSQPEKLRKMKLRARDTETRYFIRFFNYLSVDEKKVGLVGYEISISRHYTNRTELILFKGQVAEKMNKYEKTKRRATKTVNFLTCAIVPSCGSMNLIHFSI